MAIINGYENGLSIHREKNRPAFSGINPIDLALTSIPSIEHNVRGGGISKLKKQGTQIVNALHSSASGGTTSSGGTSSHGGTVTTRTRFSNQ
jgi:hypothetical protein